MATWTSEEDGVLSETILDYMRRGASITEAITRAANKLNRPIESCNGRWYDCLQYRFKEAVESIRKSVKRINDYVGDWNHREDQKFIDMMVRLQAEGHGVIEAINAFAIVSGRSLSSCNNRWYSYIIPRNKLTISNMITEAKEQMQKSTNGNVTRSWTADNENIAISIVLNTIRNGGTIKSAFEKIGEKFGKSYKTISTYWYEFLYQENQEKIREARAGQTVSSTYDEETKFKLYTMIMDALNNGEGITAAIRNAAEKLGKPFAGASNIWYNYIRNDETYKDRYEDEKQRTKEKEEQKEKVFTTQEDEIILAEVLKAIRIGRGLMMAFKEASSILQCKFSEVENRWRTTLQYTYAKKLKETRETKEAEPKVENNKPEEPVAEQPKEAKPVETPVAVGFDITKINEFLAMVQNMATENASLKAQLAEANDKIAKYEELEAQNKQLLDAVERARQFLNFDISQAIAK